MKTILITGTSSGIGRASALRFAEHGYQVFAGVRRIGDAPVHANIRPVQLDVTSPESIDEAHAFISARTNGSLHALVNNAGTNLNGAFEYTPVEEARALLDLNLWGPIQMMVKFLPMIRRASDDRWRGKIVTVGSIGSVAAVPWMAHYHGSKFGILGTMEALRHELHAVGVRVSVVCPGGVRTEFQRRTAESLERARSNMPNDAPATYRSSFERFAGIIAASEKQGVPPESVARALLRTVESRNPRFKVVVGPDARLIHCLKRCLPEPAFHAIYRRLFTSPH